MPTGADEPGLRPVDLPRRVVLDDFLVQEWAAPAPALTAAVAAERAAAGRAAAAHRQRLTEVFPGDVVVVPCGVLQRRSNDTHFPFRAHSAHVWLTGSQEPDSVLVLAAGSATLYARPRSAAGSAEFFEDRRYGEFWAGPRPSAAELTEVLGLDCRPLDDLVADLRGRARVRVLRGVDPSVDAAVVPMPGGADRELDECLGRLRIVKDDWEISQLQGAVDETVAGFGDCVREWNAVLAHGERWIEGTFARRARLRGNGIGYSSIAAAGPHATSLHWNANDGQVSGSDLVLMDMGVELNSLYTADITRTVPASGQWTELQRDLYSIVLAAQDAGIAAVRPGARFRDFHRACVAALVDGLADLGLLPCSRAEAMDESSTVYGRWVLAGSGHMLGLDVHDCRGGGRDQSLDELLEPGSVLTVEPGLYFRPDDLRLPEWLRGIGIRIEDDLVVTGDGARNLGRSLPRTPDGIVEWMAEAVDGGG